MFKNYLKVAIRSLWKNKGFSAINIVGLAVGLATCLLITLYVLDELSFDQYNTKADRTFRVDPDIHFGTTQYNLAVASDLLAPTLAKEYPQVETTVRFRQYGGFRVKKGNENMLEQRVLYADASLFDVFTLPMIKGNPATALKDPNSIVLTESTAKKYFNGTEAVGQSLVINDTSHFTVTGVIKDIPVQSHFRADFLVSLSTSDEIKKNTWLSNNFNTYVVLRPGTDPAAFEKNIQGIVTRHIAPEIKIALKTSLEDFEKQGNHFRLQITPLLKIHLHSSKTAELGPNSSIDYVYIFSAVAVFILLIACVNFMNLSTARSANRAREVGVRKVLGSLRSQLILQFLAESMLVSLIAMLLALFLTWASMPWFNQLSGKAINIGLISITWLLPVLLLIVLLAGLLAGSYPAFFLSAYQPIQVLKGKLAGGFKTGWLRNSLVVFQFGIAIFLIIGTVVIYNQLNYIRQKNLGYNRSQILVIQNGYALGKQAKAFEEAVKQLPAVEASTVTGFLPTADYRNDNTFFKDHTLDQSTALALQVWSVDDQYIPTLGMQMAKGRNFSKQFGTDSNAVILNEAAVKIFGLTDPINKQIYTFTDATGKSLKPYTVIGVVKDFNFNSLRQEVTPLGLFLEAEQGNLAFRINTTDVGSLISKVEQTWKTIAPGQPFLYSFMNEDFDNIYRAEQRTGSISLAFSILAICIACLGLFGLAAYAAEQRTKEIGIRKVLGATVTNIVGMLSKDFLKLVIISALVAFPFAWWAMNNWLQSYAYRISIGWWVFAVTGGVAVIIAVFTVSFQAIRAALANPAKSLHTE